MIRKFIIIIGLISILLTGCSRSEKLSFNDEISSLIKNSGISKINQIIHIEPINGYFIVFFEAPDGLRHVLVKKTGSKYALLGGSANTEMNPQQGLSWGMSNDPTIPLLLFSGIITNTEISKVHFYQNTQEQDAKIINSNGTKLWFAIFSKLEQAKNGVRDRFEAQGLSNEGKIITKLY